MSTWTKAQRLDEFFRRLQSAASARTHDEARELMESTLNNVEDQYSGVRFNPDAWRTDGRMYPVQDDNAADVPGTPNVTSYRSRRHETFVAANGAFEIRDTRTNRVLLAKAGADGKGVWP